jgi:hypothetical protein
MLSSCSTKKMDKNQRSGRKKFDTLWLVASGKTGKTNTV